MTGMKLHFDDGLAPEADVYLTSIVYTRTNASTARWNLLRKRIKLLKQLFNKEHGRNFF